MRRAIFAGLAFVFPLAMTFWDMDDRIAHAYPFTAPYVVWLPLASFIVGVLFILSAAVELVGWWIELYYRLAPSALRNVSVTCCKADDLTDVVNIAEARIGATTNLENTKLLYHHNKRSIWTVRDSIRGTIIGYYCILPLTAKGEEKVKERDLLVGKLDTSCFAKSFRKGSPVYIGGIAGLSTKAGAAAIEQMKAFIVKIEATRAYARPATNEGVRLVKRYGFVPVSEHDTLDKGVYVCRIRQF